MGQKHLHWYQDVGFSITTLHYNHDQQPAEWLSGKWCWYKKILYLNPGLGAFLHENCMFLVMLFPPPSYVRLIWSQCPWQRHSQEARLQRTTSATHFHPCPNNSRISQQLPEKPAKLAKKTLKTHSLPINTEQFLNDSSVSGEMLPAFSVNIMQIRTDHWHWSKTREEVKEKHCAAHSL